jgi:hypothetical protein
LNQLDTIQIPECIEFLVEIYIACDSFIKNSKWTAMNASLDGSILMHIDINTRHLLAAIKNELLIFLFYDEENFYLS